MGIKHNTVSDFTLEGITSVQTKAKASKKPVFPNVAIPKVSDKEFEKFIDELVKLDMKDFEDDERAEYILGNK